MPDSQALTVIGKQELQQGGLGVDFSSNLFSLTPATLNIVQNMSDVVSKGVPPGKLYIKDTEQAFNEMRVALLALPQQQRDFYIGEKRTLDTRMCYSRDLITPDNRATEPQSPTCAGCPQADWTAWRNSSLPNVQKRHLIPKCEISYYVVLIDTVYKMPLQMWIRGASKDPFEAGIKNLSRTLYMLKSSGLNPNIFDVSFKLSSEPGKQKNHVIKLSDFKAIDPSEREAFGEVYSNYVNSRTQAKQIAAQSQAELEATKEVAAEMSEPGTVTTPVEGEYVSF